MQRCCSFPTSDESLAMRQRRTTSAVGDSHATQAALSSTYAVWAQTDTSASLIFRSDFASVARDPAIDQPAIAFPNAVCKGVV